MKLIKPQLLRTYQRLYLYVKPFLWFFAFAVVGNLLYSAVDSAFIYLLKPMLDQGFNQRSASFISWLPLMIVGLFLVRGCANFIANYGTSYVARNVIMHLRRSLFDHCLKLPASYYDHHSSGQMLSAMLYNVEQVAKASTDSLTTLLQSSALIIGLLTVMFINSWQLTLVYIVIAPLVAIALKYSSKRLRKVNHHIQESMASVTSIAEESLEGYREVRIYGGQQYESHKFANATETNRQREMKIVVTKAMTESTVQLLAASAIALTVYLAVSPSAAMLSAGGFASIIGAMLAILRPMKNLTRVNASIQRGLAGAESVFAILDQPVEQDSGKLTFEKNKGEVTFQDVNFTYSGATQAVLKDINLAIHSGQTIALVGRSGAGKTSLVSLLPRFYETTSGRILLNGQDICDFRLNELRESIAIVSQNVVLFNDTIANNIAYGQKKPDKSAIKQAAIAAHAWSFIESLPEGLDTLIGENGMLLSGGQRQRIAIARAILKDAPILILDEATSALDTESERYIQAALDELMQSRTTFVIAHRLSTIENADLIVVMDQGRIVEQGDHQSLIAANAHYAQLHRLQFEHHPVEHQTMTELAND